MAICFVSTRKLQSRVKRKAPLHLMKPLALDSVLATFMSKKKAVRSQIVKAVWVYAKKNGLQRGSSILNDRKLKPLFGSRSLILFGDIATMIKTRTAN